MKQLKHPVLTQGSQSLLFLLFLLASRNSTLFYLQVAKKWQNLLFFGAVDIKKNINWSQFPKTQNKPLKFFSEFHWRRSELQTEMQIFKQQTWLERP